MDDEVNRLANWLRAHHPSIRRGSTVALIMANQPRFITTWVALAKLGAVCSLININLRSRSLRHSLLISGKLDAVVVDGPLLSDALNQVLEGLQDELALPILVLNDRAVATTHPRLLLSKFTPLDDALNAASTADPPVIMDLDMESPLFYVFTRSILIYEC